MKRPVAPLVAAVLLLGTTCGGSSATPERSTAASPPPPPASIVVPNGRPLKIGVSAPLSGDQLALGADIADAVEMAAAEFGELRGHPIEVIRRDDGCTDPERAELIARAFITEDALGGVIGPMCTTGAQAANDVYEGAALSHISPTVTRVELSGLGERFFFRVAWRDDVQASLQARYLRETLGLSTAAVIDDGDAYGVALAGEFVSRFEQRGGRVISRERVLRGTTDLSALVREVQGTEPALVVYQGFNPEGALLLNSLRGAGYAGVFAGPDAMLSIRDFLDTIGGAGEGAILTGGPTPDDAFAARFFDRFGRLPATPFVLQAHDAVTVLLRAIDASATSGADGRLVIDRLKLADTLRTQRFEGLTGPIAFDDRGDRRGAAAGELGLAIYQIAAGQLERVE